MKIALLQKIALLSSFIFSLNSHFSQTALDFNTTDCNGNPVHLFSDLDAGKAVILIYYMPNCSPCPAHATAIQTMANQINVDYPGMVKAYAYPYQDVTDCVYSTSWVVDNNLPLFIPMNNGAASLNYYGEFAMPTIVLLGGTNHDVLHLYDQGFYDSDTTQMRGLILDLINPAQANTENIDANVTSLEVFPNPSSDVLTVRLNLKEQSNVSFDLVDVTGRIVLHQKSVEMKMGQQEISVSEVPNGSYVLKMNINGVSSNQKVTVKH
jgi:hypothetical protein